VSPARSRLAGSASAVFAALVFAALLTGCGGSSAADVAAYAGTWQRVDAGEPNPDFTLTIAAAAEGADVTFANLANGMSETVPAAVEDDSLACVLPVADAPAPGATPAGLPSRSDLRLGLDDTGQLVVDVVLPDGTLEPIWIYERAPAPDAGEP
jgi:hypothetical protein